ncbi:single-stranded DNA-binding protein, mitochondrial-like [Pomacea canaliculata]|uniref:single-stranded DNA-binding protein, mitochondrial-like n=1 Tax=Pomacea canaliculata TaxID=400727 RepID=UPI000D726717|nr:single-stranded DNA-binding protein, mitochondrial-like [Pomacea canaliculata]
MLRAVLRKTARPVLQLHSGCRKCFSDMAEDEDGAQSNRFEKSINQVNLLGRIGRDAENRGSAAHPVVVFSLATNSVHTRSDGQTASRVEWHRVSVFKPGLREKIAANLKKGDRVFVTGVIRYDEYTDNQDNQVRTTTILANDIVNLTKRYLREEKEETVETGF